MSRERPAFDILRPVDHLVTSESGESQRLILAFFAVQGFGVDAFSNRGGLNQLAIIAKAVELVLAVCAGYLYTNTST